MGGRTRRARRSSPRSNAASRSSPPTRRCWPTTPANWPRPPRRARADLYFEAAVAGAIPVIRPLTQSLAGDRVLRVAGIVNGTTNFILSAMDETGADYASALAEASAPRVRRGRPDRRRRGLRRRGQGRDPGVDRVPHPGDRRRRLPRGHHQGHRRPTSTRRGRSAARSSCSRSASASSTTKGKQRVSARVYPALVPLRASAGLGQRRVQRGGRRGRGRRPADVLRPGRRRRADRVGGDG